jgi:Leucine-rich repeat (LRR) protein
MKKAILHIIFFLLLLSLLLQSSPVRADIFALEQDHVDVTMVTSSELLDAAEVNVQRTVGNSEVFHESMIPDDMPEMEDMSDELERKEYIPPSEEIIAATREQVRSFDCSTVTDVPQIECEALVRFYESTNGAGWQSKSNWLVTETVGSWFGVSILDGYVTQLSLSANQLSGVIPPELLNLNYLTVLKLNGNYLNGNIPPELGYISNLTVLYLSSNQLSGSLPSDLGYLSNLVELKLAYNQLSGSIPSELGNLSNLTVLYLSSNQLSGSIPLELGNLGNLVFLYLNGNQLSGSIPSDLGNLSNLTRLFLIDNQLSGSIPLELGNLGNLAFLHLNGNQLSGSIPSELGSLSSLQELKVYDNQLTGAIPPELGNLSSLQELHLYDNQLTGAIPPELGNLSSLLRLYLYNNQLTGAIPPELGNLSSLQILYLYNNQIMGSIPSELGNLGSLQELNLWDNQLIGSIPPALGNLGNLGSLLLHENQLSGSIPPELANITKLFSLNLSNNNLSGMIPPQFGNYSDLYYLNLSYNLLSGSIPYELGNLIDLWTLSLSFNQLTGSIPRELGNLSASGFSQLNLSYNNLTGEIPKELGNLTSLSYLGLSNNQLSGSIPYSLSNLTKITYFYLHNNNLTGSVPLNFVNLTNLVYFYFYGNHICEPNTLEYQAWAASIKHYGSGVLCGVLIEIANIEFNQSIQDENNDVPLIAGKDTVVRVFVKSLDGKKHVIRSASIRAFNNSSGQELPDSPQGLTKSGSVITIPWSNLLLRTENDHKNYAFVFNLPESWTKDPATIRFEIEIMGLKETRTMEFRNGNHLRIVYVPIEYEGQTAGVGKKYIDNANAIIRSMYPFSDITMKKAKSVFHFDGWPWYCTVDILGCRSKYMLKELNKFRKAEYANYDFIIGYIPAGLKNELGSDFSGASLSDLKAAIINDGDNFDDTLAHEVGHLLNQEHMNNDDCVSGCDAGNCRPPRPYSYWPYSNNSIQKFGFNITGNEFKSPDSHDDIMSYCYSRWISPFRYNNLLAESDLFNSSPLVEDRLEISGYLVLSGMIFTDDSAYLDPVRVVDSEPDWDNPLSGSGYCLQAVDISSVVLDEVCFDLDLEPNETQEPFTVDSFLIYLPENENIARVMIKKGDLELTSIQVSETVPEVEILSPNGGETWGADEIRTVQWQGSDLDGDTLYYDVFYSSDGGLNWSPLAIDLQITSLDVYTGDLPGSENAFIRVAVSDGFNNDSDESDAIFSVDAKLPHANIITPVDNQEFLSGTSIILNGSGYDPEDGILDGSVLCWSSSLDGDLGCGETILPVLSSGEHLITLQVQDSDGNIVSASSTINVVECYYLVTNSIPSEAGSVQIDTFPNCSVDPGMYAPGTEVVLSIENDPKFEFLEWSGSIGGSDLPVSIFMDYDFLINAQFEQILFIQYLPLISR